MQMINYACEICKSSLEAKKELMNNYAHGIFVIIV